DLCPERFTHHFLDFFSNTVLSVTHRLSPFNLDHDIRLNLVPLFKVIEFLDRYAALIACCDFFGVILTAFQRIQFTSIHADALPHDSYARIAGDFTVRHIGTGNGTHFGHFECLAYFDVADHFFLIFRIQHAFHRRFDFLDHLVDDAVESEIHFLPLRRFFGVDIRADIEADDDCAGCRSKRNVRFIDGTDACMDDPYIDAFYIDFHQRRAQCLYGALDVTFDDQVEIFHLSFLHLFEQVVQADFLCLFTVFQHLLLGA